MSKAIKALQGPYDCREIFDPVQTHAIYKVHAEAVPELKAMLKTKFKATRFRVVKTQVEGLVILCFKDKETTDAKKAKREKFLAKFNDRDNPHAKQMLKTL